MAYISAMSHVQWKILCFQRQKMQINLNKSHVPGTILRLFSVGVRPKERFYRCHVKTRLLRTSLFNFSRKSLNFDYIWTQVDWCLHVYRFNHSSRRTPTENKRRIKNIMAPKQCPRLRPIIWYLFNCARFLGSRDIVKTRIHPHTHTYIHPSIHT